MTLRNGSPCCAQSAASVAAAALTGGFAPKAAADSAGDAELATLEAALTSLPPAEAPTAMWEIGLKAKALRKFEVALRQVSV